MTTQEDFAKNPYLQYRDSTNIECLRGYSHVALYIDGKYNQSEFIDDFEHVRLYTIYGNLEAGILDYEPGNPLYGDIPSVRNYLIGRARLDRRGRIYCDRDDLIHTLFHAVQDLPHEWVIATLDDFPWSPQGLVNDILKRSNGEILVSEDKIWGNQWKKVKQTNPEPGYDQSSMFRYW